MRGVGRVGDRATASWPSVLRALVVLFFVLDLTSGPASVRWWGWPLSLVAALSGLVALVRPAASVLPLVLLLIGVAVARPYPVWQVPMFISVVTIWHSCRPRFAALVTLAYLPFAVVFSVRLGDLFLGLVVLSSIPIGMVTRWLASRQRSGEVEIDSLSRQVEEVHRRERAALADELSDLLSDSLGAAASALDGVSSRTDTETVALLHEVDQTSRAMLARLRRLVSTLRPDRAPEFSGAEASALDAALESWDEELAGHAFFVEVDDARHGPVGVECEALLARAVAVAGEHIVTCGVPGTTCRITLGLAGGHARLSVACDVDDEVVASPTAGRTLRDAVVAAGGRMGTAQARGAWTMWVSVPTDSGRQPTSLGLETPGRAPRWQDPRLWQAGLVAFALAMAVLELVRTVSAISPNSAQVSAIWLVTWLASALAVVRPRWAAVILSSLCLAEAASGQPVDGFVPLDLQVFVLFVVVATRRPGWMWFGGFADLLVWLALVPRGIGLGTAVAHAFMGLAGLGPGLVANHFLTARAEQSAALERLNRERLEAAAGERRLVASELHDIVAHQLSMMSLETGGDLESLDRAELLALAGRVGRINASARADLDTLVALLRQDADAEPAASPATDRTSAVGLGTPVATAQAVAENLRRAGFSVQLQAQEGADDCDPTTSRTLARVLREASTNVLRYADPGSSCEVEVLVDDRSVTARVSSAMPSVDRHDPQSTGLGLEGLAERVRLTGGTFVAGPSLGQWRVACELERFPTA